MGLPLVERGLYSAFLLSSYDIRQERDRKRGRFANRPISGRMQLTRPHDRRISRKARSPHLSHFPHKR